MRTVGSDTRLSCELSIRGPREILDRTLGRGIINQTGVAPERVDRAVERDDWLLYRTILQVIGSRFGEVEGGVGVGVKSVKPVFRG